MRNRQSMAIATNCSQHTLFVSRGDRDVKGLRHVCQQAFNSATRSHSVTSAYRLMLPSHSGSCLCEPCTDAQRDPIGCTSVCRRQLVIRRALNEHVRGLCVLLLEELLIHHSGFRVYPKP